jgi:hypothetical protein
VGYAAKTLNARFREHDNQEVIPAKAGIQVPYIQLQAALNKPAKRHLSILMMTPTPCEGC